MDLWQSFINLLIQALTFLYGIFGSYGTAIIVFTVIVRLLFLPLSIKSTKSMREVQANQARLKPQMDALKKKYGNDRQRLLEEQQKLYKELGINPLAGMGGCLPILIQFPIWIGLYSALITLSGTSEFKAAFLWIPDLGATEGFPYALAILTGVTTWATQRMAMQPTNDPTQKTMNSMMQFMPLMMVFFAFQVPAGLVLYWVVSNIFQFFQQLYATGWGQLWPSRARPTAVAAAAAASAITSSDGGSGSAKQKKAEARARQEQKESRMEDPVVAAEVQVMDTAHSTVKDGIRVYTLEPDGSFAADYTAEGPSANMDEAVARAKGQYNPRKKKRRR